VLIEWFLSNLIEKRIKAKMRVVCLRLHSIGLIDKTGNN
jgi:hypothetical protein